MFKLVLLNTNLPSARLCFQAWTTTCVWWLLVSLAVCRADEFEATARPLFQKYCVECHGGKKTKADIDLAAFKTEAGLPSDQQLLLDVVAQLESYAMPPEKAEPLPDAARQQLIASLTQLIDAIDARAPKTPGRAPLHRLNRAEYRNTMRDLVGLDLPLTDDFPADDIAHGFDNVSEALSLSPLLLEKYLAAAERILDRAIVPEGVPVLLEAKVAGVAMRGARPNAAGSAAEVPLEREVSTTIEVPQADDYTIRLRVSQSGAAGEPATVVLKVDGVDAKVWNLYQENHTTTCETVIPLGAGARKLSALHTWHMSLPKGKTAPDARLTVESLEIVGPITAAAHRRIFSVEPSATEREAAQRLLERFATRAFRRPAEPGEIERLLGLYDQQRAAGKSHVEAARVPLLSVLVSPQFLFRIERDRADRDEAGAFRLSDWELASRLSYFLWSSMPDEELFRLCAEGKLRDPAVLRAQVSRMLADPKAQALSENFAAQWLALRKLETTTPDPELFPAFTPSLRRAMAAEVRYFFEAVMREDRSILEFVNADWTFANEELARQYGIKDVPGGTMRKIPLAGTPRGGVLTMAAVLTANSYPTRTSPVKRGKWILEEILGAPPPPPPPNVPELDTPARGQKAANTVRERLARHRADPNCSGCHVRMDALGLGLENFDAVGRWREKEGDLPIDPSGTLPGRKAFKGPAELKALLAGHEQEFARTLVEKMFVYALGRGVQRGDRQEIKRVTAALAENGWRFSTLIAEIASSYPFQYRLGPDAEKPKAAAAPSSP
jgi:hypothetical protein